MMSLTPENFDFGMQTYFQFASGGEASSICRIMLAISRSVRWPGSCKLTDPPLRDPRSTARVSMVDVRLLLLDVDSTSARW